MLPERTIPGDLAGLYAALRDPLHRFLTRRVRDDAVAEDLLHEVFLRIHARSDTLRDMDRLESWIYAIARNAIVDWRRREKPTVDLDASIPEPAEDDDTSRRELAASVRTCIEYLPQPYREALRLTALEGVSQRELAARLGLSHSGAKSRVQRARRMLADMYRNCCALEIDARGCVVGYVKRADCRFVEPRPRQR